MATSPAGLLCVVALDADGKLTAAMVDLEHAADAEFQTMTAPDDRALMPSVTHATDRFVVGWLSAMHNAVVVRELRDDRARLPAVTMAAAAQLDNPLLALRPEQQGVSVLTRTRTGLTLSRVETPIAGRSMALAYIRARCR